jgi:hypothetical protein
VSGTRRWRRDPIDAEDVALCGGKATGLARLLKASFPVKIVRSAADLQTLDGEIVVMPAIEPEPGLDLSDRPPHAVRYDHRSFVVRGARPAFAGRVQEHG